MTVLGPFSAQTQEFREVREEIEQPYVVDRIKYERAFSYPPTHRREAIR